MKKEILIKENVFGVFCVKADKNNPLFRDFINWLNSLIGGTHFSGCYTPPSYYGCTKYGTYDCTSAGTGSFNDNEITLEHWYEVVTKKPTTESLLINII